MLPMLSLLFAKPFSFHINFCENFLQILELRKFCPDSLKMDHKMVEPSTEKSRTNNRPWVLYISTRMCRMMNLIITYVKENVPLSIFNIRIEF